MTVPLNLTASERAATLWAVSASHAILDRAEREGRTDTADLHGSVPMGKELAASLEADVLHDADSVTVSAALRFAVGLYEEGLADIRVALSPPPLADLISALTKIEA